MKLRSSRRSESGRETPMGGPRTEKEGKERERERRSRMSSWLGPPSSALLPSRPRARNCRMLASLSPLLHAPNHPVHVMLDAVTE